ncbi:PEP-CTERM sorting domain-containing protein [Gloeocapsa sp. PCC 73106]|uniref:PEP-CTERM sorting domain-containing protein n=1 Tax=Gloeocapsa sp. PCC 73106 TaxID=102232 RepID=UPI0002AC960B|nr:PEP-CTERM sorting domain-containing protein [Gloeocapsa sp. PCC 73106]ELR99220.1 hypothetical protein GLO73106DRAFT_00030700 [Gloeocapsa sp. PCC 73106]
MFKFHLTSRILLSSLLGVTLLPLSANANDTFETRTILPLGTTEVSGTISPQTYVTNAPVMFTISNLEPSETFLAWTDNSFSNIDTVLGNFDESFNLIDSEDDGSPAGNGLGSALVGEVNRDGTIHLGVTGYSDLDFSGNTPERGEFELFVKLGTDHFTEIEDDNHDDHDHHDEVEHDEDEDSLDRYRDEHGHYDHIEEETVDLSDFDHSFTGEIVPEPSIPGNVDFYNFNNLTPGEIVTAEINQGNIDSVLGLFDDEGNLVMVDDDNGVESLSRLSEIVVPASGELNLAVTGYPDFEFIGRQLEEGEYVLSLHNAPEPMTILGTAVVLGCLPGIRKAYKRN